MSLAADCASNVHPDTMFRLVSVESSFNPYAIGVVNGRLERSPRTLAEAVATAEWLEANGFNYSVGLAQVNKSNFARHGLTPQTAFDTCANLRAGGAILQECFSRARKKFADPQAALRAAFSCYYSGNFSTGFKEGYVAKVVAGGGKPAAQVPVVVRIVTPVHRASQASGDGLAEQGEGSSALMF